MGEQTTHVPVGVGFTPFESRLDVIEAVAVRAESRGLAFVSVAEAMSLDAPLVLGRLASRTSSIELATGVLSVWGRTPGTRAMTASELQRQSSGRFVLGLGAGTEPITQGFHGREWRAPLRQVRATCIAVRALLAGERLPDAPEGARPLALAIPPQQPVPLSLAAVTEPGIRLAGELADRWMPFLMPTEGLDRGRRALESVAAEHGRSAPSVTAAVPVALARDSSTAAALAARWLVTYCTRMGPVYPRVLREHGYGPEIEALLAANPDPRHPVLPTESERLAHDVLAFGLLEDAPEVLSRWRQHADAIGLVLPFGADVADLLDVVDAVVG